MRVVCFRLNKNWRKTVAGIPLSMAASAIVYNSVPWAKHSFSLKTESFPKGAVPAHLASHLFKAGGVPAECARKTVNLSGKNRIHSMNSCVSQALRR